MVRQPYSSMVAEPSGGMTVVAVASSTMAGPAMAQHGYRDRPRGLRDRGPLTRGPSKLTPGRGSVTLRQTTVFTR